MFVLRSDCLSMFLATIRVDRVKHPGRYTSLTWKVGACGRVAPWPNPHNPTIAVRAVGTSSWGS
jgi:hypothetical protein